MYPRWAGFEPQSGHSYPDTLWSSRERGRSKSLPLLPEQAMVRFGAPAAGGRDRFTYFGVRYVRSCFAIEETIPLCAGIECPPVGRIVPAGAGISSMFFRMMRGGARVAPAAQSGERGLGGSGARSVPRRARVASQRTLSPRSAHERAPRREPLAGPCQPPKIPGLRVSAM